MKKYWFKPKSYGYGFFPISWEGWVSVLVLIGLLFISAYVNNFFTSEAGLKNGLRYLLDILIISGVFTALFKDKTDGDLQWRWGCRKEQKRKSDVF